MNIIFIKRYIDTDSFDNPVIIEQGEEAELIDEVNGIVELSEGYAVPVTLSFVPVSYYAEKRTDLDEKKYELHFCKKCLQMTNYLNGKCQKCKKRY